MSEFVTTQTWFCGQCGRKNEPGGLFCGGCGNRAPQWAIAPAAPVESEAWFCPQCGHKNSAAGAFCPQCGTGRTPLAAPVIAAVPAPEADVPAEASVETPVAVEEMPKKKKKTGLVVGLIALILVVLLAAGGAVWHFFLREDPAASAGEEVETEDEEERDEDEDGESGADEPGDTAGNATAAPAEPEEEPQEELRNGTYVEENEDGVSTYYYEDGLVVRREKQYNDGSFKINTFLYDDEGTLTAITWEQYGVEGLLTSSGIEYVDENENSTGYDSYSYYPNGQIRFEYIERYDENGDMLYNWQVGYDENGVLNMESGYDRETGEEYQISYEGDWIYSTYYEKDENGTIRWEERDYRQQTEDGEWHWEVMEYDEYGNQTYREVQDYTGYGAIYTTVYLDPARGMISQSFFESSYGDWSEAVYVYDGERLVERVENTGGNGTAGGSTTTYEYDEQDRCIYEQQVFLDGRTAEVFRSYDEYGNVVWEEQYDKYGNVRTKEYSYNERGEILYGRETYGEDSWWEQRYEYYESGNLKFHEYYNCSPNYEQYQYSEYSPNGGVVLERGWTRENGELTSEYERVY